MSEIQKPTKKTFPLLRIVQVSAVICATVLIFCVLQQLLMPKYASAVYEGGMIREYYDSTMNHDVIFLGDCEAYTTYSPVILWDEFGITSYIRGSPQQLIWHSYYVLEDLLRYETPKIVVLNVAAMKYGEPQSEPYNRLTIDGMRFSTSKIGAVNSSRTEDEDRLSYFLPFFRYKDRWRELTAEDFRYFINKPRVSINGFMPRTDILEAGFIPDPILPADYSFSEKAYQYLESITELSKENNITLILVKAPTLYPHWHEEWEEQIVTFANRHNLTYINFMTLFDDIGLDFSVDTFNAGISLNVSGAEKLTRYFSEVLKEYIEPTQIHNDEKTIRYWSELTTTYKKVINRQQEEIGQTGKIINFLIDY